MDPHRVEGGLDRDLGGEQLGHPGLHVDPLAGVEQTGRNEHQEPRGLHLGRHRREPVPDRLMLPDRLAEGLPLLAVADGGVEGCLGDPDRPGGDLDPADLEAAHHLGPAETRLAADHVGGRYDDVVEADLGRLDSLVAELGEVAGDGHAVLLADEEHAHPGVRRARLRIGLAQHRDAAGPSRIRDPGLLAAQNVGVLGCVVRRGRRHRLEVAAPGRLGEGHRDPHAAVGHHGQMFSLLLLRAELTQQVGDDGVAADDTGQAHPATRQALGHQREAFGADSDPAVLLRHQETEEPEGLHPLDEVLGIDVVGFVVAHPRHHIVVDELVNQGQDFALVVPEDRNGGRGFHTSYIIHDGTSRQE